jgi:hypothetical protein
MRQVIGRHKEVEITQLGTTDRGRRLEAIRLSVPNQPTATTSARRRA